jgi:hypothetical protein
MSIFDMLYRFYYYFGLHYPVNPIVEYKDSTIVTDFLKKKITKLVAKSKSPCYISVQRKLQHYAITTTLMGVAPDKSKGTDVTYITDYILRRLKPHFCDDIKNIIFSYIDPREEVDVPLNILVESLNIHKKIAQLSKKIMTLLPSNTSQKEIEMYIKTHKIHNTKKSNNKT